MDFSKIYSSDKKIFSLEFFPPKSEEKLSDTLALIDQLSELAPDFMTVTYGAAGGTREYTKQLTAHIAQDLSIPAVAHLTCVGHTRGEIDTLLDEHKANGIKHILALRGDVPEGATEFVQPEGGFSCARDLAAHIKTKGDFSVAIAGYPEVHPDAESALADLEYLAEKEKAGGEVIMTQLFFDADLYTKFVTDAREQGITIPIVPGIMPISNLKQVKRFTSLCGASIPQTLLADLESLGEDKEKVIDFGTHYALELSKKLLAAGAPGIHFYTLNRARQVEQILSQLR